MTHPFSAQMKNKEIREIISKILEEKGLVAISNLNSQIDDSISECLGFLASKHINNDEVKSALMCVILHKLISIYEPIMKASEKKSPLFFWEIKSILPDRL
jgi:hypothetical protein